MCIHNTVLQVFLQNVLIFPKEHKKALKAVRQVTACMVIGAIMLCMGLPLSEYPKTLIFWLSLDNCIMWVHMCIEMCSGRAYY